MTKQKALKRQSEIVEEINKLLKEAIKLANDHNLRFSLSNDYGDRHDIEGNSIVIGGEWDSSGCEWESSGC